MFLEAYCGSQKVLLNMAKVIHITEHQDEAGKCKAFIAEHTKFYYIDMSLDELESRLYCESKS